MMTWHPEDKDWMRERNKMWLELKNNYIEPHSWFKQKDLKQVRNYFLTGEEDLNNPLPDYSHRKSLAKYPVPLFIKLWFYPEPSLDLFKYWLKTAKPRGIKDCYFSVGAMNSQSLDSDYGMMGGREELLVKSLYGETFAEYKKIHSELLQEHKTDTGYANGFSGFPVGTASWLRYGYPVYISTQYEINHWYESLQYRKDLNESSMQGDIVYLMYQVAFFKDPFDLPPEESRYYKVAEMLKDIFENKPLPPVVKELWEKVKNKEVEVPEWYR